MSISQPGTYEVLLLRAPGRAVSTFQSLPESQGDITPRQGPMSLCGTRDASVEQSPNAQVQIQ